MFLGRFPGAISRILPVQTDSRERTSDQIVETEMLRREETVAKRIFAFSFHNAWNSITIYVIK